MSLSIIIPTLNEAHLIERTLQGLTQTRRSLFDQLGGYQDWPFMEDGE